MNKISAGGLSYQRGLAAEAIAASHYLARDAALLGRRQRIGGGEIDLILRQNDQTIFVEVKARQTLAAAAWSLSRRQIGRIGNAALSWLAANGSLDDDVRFDVVLVDSAGRYQVIENALTFDA
jgi:putative endonuclease